MRILFTTQALTIGGIEVLALRFSEAFGAAGQDRWTTRVPLDNVPVLC